MPTLADRSVSPPRYSHLPHALSITLPDLVAADGHRVSVAVSCTARLLERLADVAVFNERFGGSEVGLDDVRRYLAEQLQPDVSRYVADRSAEASIDGTAELQAATMERLNAIGFGCGLEFLPPIVVKATSDSLAADRLAAAAARRQTAALDRAADLRKRLADGAAGFVGVTDIAELLPTLLQTEPRTATHFFLAAGPNCIDVAASPPEAVAMPAAASIGHLRSCRPVTVDGESMLALGGQRGVALQALGSEAPAATFTIAGLTSPRGFNAIGLSPAQRQLVATHSELGIVRWTLGSDAPPAATPLPGARLLLPLDDRQVLASGGELIVAGPSPKTIHSDAAPVVALVDLDETIAIVRAGGEVMRVDRTTLEPVSTFNHSTPLRCAALLRVAGLRLLLLGTETGVIDVVTFVGQTIEHLRPRAGVSLLASAGPTIAALSADRAALELFDGLRPAATINLVARFGHRATDLVPSPGIPGEG